MIGTGIRFLQVIVDESTESFLEIESCRTRGLFFIPMSTWKFIKSWTNKVGDVEGAID
jgi:hypothetical protein